MLFRSSSGMFLSEVSSFKGDLDLRHAKATTFSDDERSWPQAGCVWLDGFSYDRFSETRTDSRIRIEWLKRQPKKHLNEDYRPQPWAQLIKALREMGHDEDAKKIAFERSNVVEQNMSWKCPMIFRKLFYKSFRITAGYGYYPSRTAYWSTFFLFFSWMTFWLAAERGYMSPRNDHPSDFAAFVYALDSFAPAIDLIRFRNGSRPPKRNTP